MDFEGLEPNSLGLDGDSGDLPPEFDRLALEVAKEQIRRSLFVTLAGPEIVVDISRSVWPAPKDDGDD